MSETKNQEIQKRGEIKKIPNMILKGKPRIPRNIGVQSFEKGDLE